MPRKDYIESVVASLNGQRHPEIIDAIVRNYGILPNIAKLALRRAIKSWKTRRALEKR